MWDAFMTATFPWALHFPTRPEHLTAYAALFHNPDTLDKHMSHEHFGERLLLILPATTRAFEASLIRGPS